MKIRNISDLFQLVCCSDLILLSTSSSSTGREEVTRAHDGEECGTASGGHCLAMGTSDSCLGKANL